MSDSAKHKTVGVSLAPTLREKATERARTLGLTFSKYVAQCLEAELDGRSPSNVFEWLPENRREPELDIQDVIEKGSEYGIAKAAAIAFEDDVEECLRAEDWCYERFARVGNLRTDFLVQQVEESAAKNGSEKCRRIALECKHSLRDRYAVTLGQAIVLRSQPEVDQVILCVPYLRAFDPSMRDTFTQQNIEICTPDTLHPTLTKAFASLQS